jgi:hypothetical protein
MPVLVDTPSNVYRDQLTSLSLGLAVWNPDPPINPNPPSDPYAAHLPRKIYDKVSIGDVGYLHDGTFIRLFNVMLPWDHPSNRTLGYPEPYESLDCGPFINTFRTNIKKVEHCSPSVSAEANDSNVHARNPDQ